MPPFKLLSKEEATETVESVSSHVKLTGIPAKLLKQAAKGKDLSIGDTVEQMVIHCLKEMYGPDAWK